MQATQTGFVTRAEWRWVILMSVTLVVVAFLPFLVVALLQSPDKDWRFMGALHQFRDAAAELSRMSQGMYGDWLMHFMHTPEPHKSALVEPIYSVLGHVASFTGISMILVFHVARLVASFLMYTAIYQLSASIWVKVRSRRVFFVICALGSGFGWILALVTGERLTPDLTTAQAFPFFATLVNIHFPLAIAGLAILAAVLIPVLRPGYRQSPDVQNGGGIVVLVVIALAFLYPEALFPIVGAFVMGVLWGWVRARTFFMHESRWILWLIVPALPIGAYYALTILSNAVVAEWIQQQTPPLLNPILFLVGFSVPLAIGLPALWRGIRRFESDGDRFFVVWLGLIVVMYYLPMAAHETFIIGIMLPIAYFATRSFDEVWLPYFSRPMRRWLFVLGTPIMSISTLFVLFVPIAPFVRNDPVGGGVALEPDYVVAFEWLGDHSNSETVVLASPDVSVWLPAWADVKVVYGHPFETVLAQEKLAWVQQWYRATDKATCYGLSGLQASSLGAYFIDFMLVGPRELALGNATCAEQFELIATFGRVSVYYCDMTCKLGERKPNAP